MSESGPIKAGDVVRLKSGGPNMTVQIVGGPLAYCVWFHKNSEGVSDAVLDARTGAFLVESLVRVLDEKNGVSGS